MVRPFFMLCVEIRWVVCCTDSSAVSITSSKPNANAGDIVTFNIDVASLSPPTWIPKGIPTGWVTLSYPGGSLSKELQSGSTAFDVPFASGFSSQFVTASYAGDDSFLTSSSSVSQTVAGMCYCSRLPLVYQFRSVVIRHHCRMSVSLITPSN